MKRSTACTSGTRIGASLLMLCFMRPLFDALLLTCHKIYISDPASSTAKAVQFASTTAGKLSLDDTRDQILDFRRQQTRKPLTASTRTYVRNIDRKRSASGDRSTLSETWNTSSDSPGWMKPQEGSVSPNTKRLLANELLVSTDNVPGWLPAQCSENDVRIRSMTRNSPKTKAMGMMDTEDWFTFRPQSIKFHISHTGMWPVKRDATTSLREDQWVHLRAAFFNTAPDGRIRPNQVQSIVKRLFGTISSDQMTGTCSTPMQRQRSVIVVRCAGSTKFSDSIYKFILQI